MFSGSWTNGLAARLHDPTASDERLRWSVKQLSGDVTSAENSTDEGINVQLGGGGISS